MTYKTAASALTLSALATAALLTACGGGGGAGTVTPGPIVIAPALPTLVTSVPTATYSGEDAAAFNLLNNERGRCGFGLLAQNKALDAAIAAHNAYQVTNDVGGHVEVVGKPGFTGVLSTNRAIAKGYNLGTNNEVLSAVFGAAGTRGIRQLLNAPYHGAALIGSYRDVGVNVLDVGNSGFALVGVTLGYTQDAGPQLLGNNDVRTYPCEGSVGVGYAMSGEEPNPVPGRDLSKNPIGTSILVKIRDGNKLVVSSASMIKVATGAVIPMRPAISVENDPHHFFDASSAYVAADLALDPLTVYQVTVAGTNNGVAFSRTFAYTTGATN